MNYTIMVVTDDEYGIGAKVAGTQIEVWGDDASEVMDLVLEQVDRHHWGIIERGLEVSQPAKILVNRVTASEFGPRVFDEEEVESPHPWSIICREKKR